jgi:hypothetical protein
LPELILRWVTVKVCFDQPITVTTWTEQNGGFTAYNVNAVAINSAGYIFAGAAGGVFNQPTTTTAESTIATESFLRVEMFRRWRSIPKGMPLLELRGGGVIDNSQRHSETEASANASTAALMGKPGLNS